MWDSIENQGIDSEFDPSTYLYNPRTLDDEKNLRTWENDYNSSTSDDSNHSVPSRTPMSSYGSNYNYHPITGSNEILSVQGSHVMMPQSPINQFSWQGKHPESWGPLDVALWIQYVAETNQLSNLRADAFADVNGPMICKMQMEQFQDREPSYGDKLCMAFNELLYTYNQYQKSYISTYPNDDVPKHLTSIEHYINMISFDKDDKFASLGLPTMDSFIPRPVTAHKNEPDSQEETNENDAEGGPPSPSSSETSSTGSPPRVGRRGRSKGKLWEFVLNLLLNNEHNPSIIKWEDRAQGVFRIVRSDQVARLWGVRKSNPSMTYEKMSRAMRYYYRKNILERIDGRRLVYKFGQSARGWQI